MRHAVYISLARASLTTPLSPTADDDERTQLKRQIEFAQAHSMRDEEFEKVVEQPAVIIGFSDLIVQVFGERGRHARAAVGMASLPRGQAVEIEMIVEVRD